MSHTHTIFRHVSTAEGLLAKRGVLSKTLHRFDLDRRWHWSRQRYSHGVVVTDSGVWGRVIRASRPSCFCGPREGFKGFAVFLMLTRSLLASPHETSPSSQRGRASSLKGSVGSAMFPRGRTSKDMPFPRLELCSRKKCADMPLWSRCRACLGLCPDGVLHIRCRKIVTAGYTMVATGSEENGRHLGVTIHGIRTVPNAT